MTALSLDVLLPILAGLTSLGLAAAVLSRRPLGRLQWSFALGMAAFGVESAVVLMLLAPGIDPDSRAGWLRVLGVVRALTPLPWVVVLVLLARRDVAGPPPTWRLTIPGAVALSAVAAGAACTARLELAASRELFGGARVLGAARYGAIAELFLLIGVLVGLEACLRTARSQNRTRIKYLVLGLGGIFLMRFYLQSQILLFQALMPDYLKIAAATVLVGNVAMAVGIARDCLRGVELAISRRIVFRSVVAFVLAVYLFAVGVLGWLVNYLEIPEKLFWGSLAVFVSAVAVAGLLLSDRLRWRVRRFVELHFYRSKYDYRAQLVAFTKRMASRVTVQEIGPELLDAVTEAVGATRAAVYLASDDRARYLLAAASGCAPAPDVDAGTTLAARFLGDPDPVILDGDVAERFGVSDMVAVLGEGAVAAPLFWRGGLTGFMLIGPERTATPYGAEDLVFIATLGELTAGAIATATMSEALARARESRAFEHLASVVAHDIKNSVSTLSWLSRAVVQHFDDREFQRDSIRTLSRTVDRMKSVLARLAAPTEGARLPSEAVDLVELVDEATSALRDDARVRLIRDIRARPIVEGDGDGLLRVFQNLVTNAVEAIDGEGTITVTVDVADGVAVVSVVDTGRGMSEEFVRRSLFAPFSTTKPGGWGVGLYQSRQVVERHRGGIVAVSSKGVGTTFRVTLPVALESAVAATPQHERKSPAPQSLA